MQESVKRLRPRAPRVRVKLRLQPARRKVALLPLVALVQALLLRVPQKAQPLPVRLALELVPLQVQRQA
jgi:hypothetical protein